MLRNQFRSLLCLLVAFVLVMMVQFTAGLVAVNAQEAGEEYIVRAGDTLFEIAAEFYGMGSLWPRIMEATNAKAQEDNSFRTIEDADVIRVGQRLWIPPLEVAEDEAAIQAEETTENVSVQIVAPADGATVPRQFEVTTEAIGLTVEEAGDVREGAGHMHILVDTDFVAAGEVIPRDEQHIHFFRGEVTGTLELEPGEHVLRLQFSDGAHLALEGDQYRDQITITVLDEAEPEEATADVSVQFVAPADGAIVPRQFEVTTAATGLTVEEAGEVREGAGHMHILVDTDFVAAGEVIPRDAQHIHYFQGELTGTLELEPGEHVLRLQFSDGAHLALEGDQYRDQITVMVSDEASIQTEERTADVSVQIVAPADGATVPRQFDVTTEATGLTVEEAGEVREGAGHMHILVDSGFVEAGELIPRDEQYIHFFRGELTGTLELEPGEHVLRLQFSDGAHLALEGDQYRDQITVTVSDEGEAEEATGDVGVEFVTPADGATVPRQFEVTMAARGLTVEPAGEIREGAGHFHILVDTDYVAPGEVIPRDAQHIHFGQGELTGTLELEPGEHVLRLQFSNGAHLALEGNQYRDQITVTVRE